MLNYKRVPTLMTFLSTVTDYLWWTAERRFSSLIFSASPSLEIHTLSSEGLLTYLAPKNLARMFSGMKLTLPTLEHHQGINNHLEFWYIAWPMSAYCTILDILFACWSVGRTRSASQASSASLSTKARQWKVIRCTLGSRQSIKYYREAYLIRLNLPQNTQLDHRSVTST